MENPTPRPPESRPHIALADALIVIAVLGLGMTVWRTTEETGSVGYLRHVPSPQSHGLGPLGNLGYVVSHEFFFALVNGVPQILVASLGVVALSLRRRGDPALPLSRRPGFALCTAAAVAAAWTLGMEWWVVDAERWSPPNFDLAFWRLIVSNLLPNAGLMVLGLWIGLALGGRAAPAASRLDRVGYGLAASLVVLLGLDTLRMMLEWARLI